MSDDAQKTLEKVRRRERQAATGETRPTIDLTSRRERHRAAIHKPSPESPVPVPVFPGFARARSLLKSREASWTKRVLYMLYDISRRLKSRHPKYPRKKVPKLINDRKRTCFALNDKSNSRELISFLCSTRHCRVVDRHKYCKAVPPPQACGQRQKSSPCHLHCHSEGLLPGASHLSLLDT